MPLSFLANQAVCLDKSLVWVLGVSNAGLFLFFLLIRHFFFAYQTLILDIFFSLEMQCWVAFTGRLIIMRGFLKMLFCAILKLYKQQLVVYVEDDAI